MPARLRVLAKGKFRRFQGNYANNSGVEFQVTECEHDGRRFFVRENFRYDTFTSNSGVRWGLQQGHTVSGVNVLEPCWSWLATRNTLRNSLALFMKPTN